ncbi:MAG: type IVB secretion system protein IcmJDotN [Gammaproteobacteria bacterium]
MYELKLSVRPGNWQRFMARKMNPAFSRIAKKIWLRDQHTCQYCGFQAREYLDVVNYDQDYDNNKARNLMTACCFCSQCFFLESVGLDEQSSGDLIYLPEISQRDLNGLCHVLFCAMSNDNDYKTTAESIYRSLKFRNRIVEETFGAGASDPRVMGEMIIEYQAQQGQYIVDDVLGSLRLLPNHAKFHRQLQAWAQSALNDVSQEKAVN